jgi:hypothetical protein
LDVVVGIVHPQLVVFVVGVVKGFMIDKSRNTTLEDSLIEVLE